MKPNVDKAKDDKASKEYMKGFKHAVITCLILAGITRVGLDVAKEFYRAASPQAPVSSAPGIPDASGKKVEWTIQQGSKAKNSRPTDFPKP